MVIKMKISSSSILAFLLALGLLPACGTNIGGAAPPLSPPGSTGAAPGAGTTTAAATTTTTAKAAETDAPTAASAASAAATAATAATTASAPSAAANVYMTSEITPKGLQAVYEALDLAPGAGDKVGVKVSTGEPPASNYLRQELIGDFVKGLNGTYIESNTAYGGRRANTAMHYQVAADHGFEPVLLMDDDGEIEIPIDGGLRLKKDIVGTRIGDFNFHIVLSHFKGHQMAGYGGALKQLSIGYASSAGKSWIHTSGKSTRGISGGGQNGFIESMADASKAVVDYVKGLDGGQIIYINVMNRLSIDCDCNGNPSEPDIHDIGILASLDPVALDRACLDLIYAADGNASFVWRVEAQNGAHVIEAAEQLGVGRGAYELINIDVI
ncbi:MAG: DUF362 domain-containing protein [Clostridiales bacterium]|nr:DUF362 domain-containing protein [Clostridiales bacterium]